MMFKVACGSRALNGWEIAPSEFWQMTPAEWWLLYDFNIGEERQEQKKTMDNLRTIFNKKVLKK